MKIIDKRKDIYDYLVGIYGIDNDVVFDRREALEYCNRSTGQTKAIYGFRSVFIKKRYDIRHRGIEGDYYFQLNKTRYEVGFHFKYKDVVYERYDKVPSNCSDDEIILIPIICSTEEVDPHPKYPMFLEPIDIRLDRNRSDYRFIPLLRDSPLKSLVDPETIYNEIYNWILSREILKAEREQRELTDIEKVENHGFDKKTSFRNM